MPKPGCVSTQLGKNRVNAVHRTTQLTVFGDCGIVTPMTTSTTVMKWPRLVATVGVAAAVSCGGDKKTSSDVDAPPGAVDAPIKVDAPPAGMTEVSWTLVRNGAAATCATVDPPNPDVKISFFQGDVNKQIKRVPCSDGKAVINVPAGSYRMALNLAPAGDPTKSGMEYASKDVVIPDQGIVTTAEMAQANARFTWVPANITACTGVAKLTMKIDKATVVSVTCTLGSADAPVPAGNKDAAIAVGTTTFAKTLSIPRAGGNVALPLP